MMSDNCAVGTYGVFVESPDFRSEKWIAVEIIVVCARGIR